MKYILILRVIILCLSTPAFAQNSTENTFNAIDTFWVLIAAFLVFFMQAGFGMVEAGLVRAKNAANLLMKNMMN